MSSKIENWAHFFTVVGVIAAIFFSGIQLYLYRQDELLRKRPYIKINFGDVDESYKMSILGIKNVLPDKHKKVFVGVLFDKNKKVRTLLYTSLMNVGEYPAYIKQFRVVLSNLDGTINFIIPNIYLKKVCIVFQNEEAPYFIDAERTPDDRDFNPSGKVEDFNELSSKLSDLVNKQDFLVTVYIEYTMFDDVKNGHIFKTTRVVQIKPNSEDGVTKEYDLE